MFNHLKPFLWNNGRHDADPEITHKKLEKLTLKKQFTPEFIDFLASIKNTPLCQHPNKVQPIETRKNMIERLSQESLYVLPPKQQAHHHEDEMDRIDTIIQLVGTSLSAIN